MKLVLGTRGSRLALAQAAEVRERLEKAFLGIEVQVRTFQTRGDKRLDIALHSHTLTKGLFTEELERSLADHSIDIAVHSLKDLPVENAPGTFIAAHLPRADARDAFLSRSGLALSDLPEGAILGSSSPRRIAQLMLLYPHLTFLPIRGNVETRIAKMRAGEYDGLIMAAAGLIRLGLEREIHNLIPFEQMLPAAGQAVIAVQCRTDRPEIYELIGQIDDKPSHTAAESERLLLQYIGGGCALPLGVLTECVAPSRYMIRAFLALPDADRTIDAQAFFTENDRDEVVRQMAQLLTKG